MEVGKAMEGGEFVRGEEPEVQGAIQCAVLGDADAGDSAADGAPERLVILGRGGEFNRQEGLAQTSREALGDGEGVGKVCKVIVVLRIRLSQHEAGGFEILVEGIEQPGQTAVSDLPQNGGLREIVQDPGRFR